MRTTKTGKVSVSITMTTDIYDFLEDIRKTMRRSKSNEISWIIMQYAKWRDYYERKDYQEGIALAPPLEKNVIVPNPSVWGRTATV